MSYLIPIVMIVASNVFYNLFTKGMPEAANPFAALVVTYLSAAALSFLLLLMDVRGKSDVLTSFGAVNWVSIGLGIAIFWLELGYILAFRAGWNISTCSLVANIALAVILLFIGMLFFQEKLTGNQFIGIALCLVGLFFVNRH
ncbi:MAG: EamA family transporter [Agathobaculum sp.]|jgi:drug/metabolite transporter (DMT)-like permease|uniref:EamA family transporter n=1 Tax=Eubacteriales TaxID=186802 RepID=UPI00189B8CB6|nr:EamA family transporter [Anaerotruncus rubiinfantis]